MSRHWRANYNVVNLYNGMTTVRNALVDLARDSSTVASNYRDIQRLKNHEYSDTIDITPKQLMEEIILKDI